MIAARIACIFSLSLLGAAALAQTAPPPATATEVASQANVQADTRADTRADTPADAPARILVTGKRPGPGLWKVAKDGHVMWVFGLYAPLPPKMEWDDGRVERLIGESQAVLAPPGASVGVGWIGGFKMLTALPSAIGMAKNRDGATLHEVLPEEVYARWSVLKRKYIGDDDDVERLRPYFAAERLQKTALQKIGLSGGVEVRKQIEAIAKRRGMKLTPTGYSVTLDDPAGMLRDFKETQMEDQACFTKTLERFEGDIDAMRARANAWANGNIAEISRLDYSERDDACNDAIINSPAARKHAAFQNMRERRLDAWLKAVERSLANNASTVALLPMGDVLGPRSYLAVLQAKGYTVESPK